MVAANIHCPTGNRTTGTNWADSAHDAAGNMTEFAKPSDLANSRVRGVRPCFRFTGIFAGFSASARGWHR